jgi:hypothetical protein
MKQTRSALSKRDLIVVAVVMACGMMWIELGHRISIEAPSPPEITSRDAACPVNDGVPYTAPCLAFLGGFDTSNRTEQSSPERGTAPAAAQLSVAAAGGNECPDNDNRPYPPACVRFLSGWFWRVN